MKNRIRDFIPLIILFAFAATLFPFFYIFTRAWNEISYGVVLVFMGLELLFSVYFTVFTKKRKAERITAAVVFTALILVFIFFIPVFYYNTVFLIGATYSAVLATAPVTLVMALNAAVRLGAKTETKKIPLLRAAALLVCAALAVLPYGYYLDYAKNEDSVGVYCHNANGVICVQNLLIDCKDKSVELNDTENSLYSGGNRVYANVIHGRKGISVGDETSISDYNVFASVPERNAMKLNVSKKAYSLKKWQSMGFDRGSVCIPMDISLNPQTLMLTVDAHGASLPAMPVVESFMQNVTGSDSLVYDFFARERDRGVFGAGAFAVLPADGEAVSVDPRCAG